MHFGSIKRALVHIRTVWRDLVFRGLALATLIFIAWGFTSVNSAQFPRGGVSFEGQGNISEQQLATYTFWLDVLTTILAVSTFGLWVATLFSFRRQASEAKKSLRIAQNSADAAKEQVALSRSALESTERAYVFCEQILSEWTAIKETEQVTKWTFTIVWRNTGKTPTRRAISNANKWEGTDVGALPSEFDYPDYASSEDMVIGPNAVMHAGGFDIPVETLVAMRAGKTRIYIWGWCEYDDVFEGTSRHRSEFCFEIIVTGNPIYKNGGFKYRRHGPFNGFDEECVKRPVGIGNKMKATENVLPDGRILDTALSVQLRLAIADAVVMYSRLDTMILEIIWELRKSDLNEKRKLAKRSAAKNFEELKEHVRALGSFDAIWKSLEQLKDERALIAHGSWFLIDGKPFVLWHKEFLTYKDEVTAELFDERRFERFMTKVTHLYDMLFTFRQMLPPPK
jgi:hypothetical protein